MAKKRVLFIGEASYIATGFGTYWNEVLSRLHKTGEFEIAEQGSYAKDNDPQIRNVPWKFYAVQPAPNDKEGLRAFNSKRTNQFGEWRFAQVCLDFKPDIIAMIRDFWMDEFVLRSPLRDKAKVVWMPTLDGIPQKQDWLDHYKLCDKVLTYSRWGYKVLEKDGRPGTNLVTVASPGVDIDVFKPPDNRREHKSKFGIDPNSIIIGTVMRNQRRKLYYDLIEAFSQWIHKTKTKGHLDLVRRTFLYLHTSYPDQGWDIGAAVKEFKVGNKVLMTYLCRSCGVAFPSFFAGDLSVCKKCKKLTAQPPNANNHVSRVTLAGIMNLFDLYVQYSICLHPNTPIMTSNGWNDIGDISVGDKVVGKDGKLHRVYKTMRSKPDKCFKVSVKGRPWSVTATDNHPWLVVDKKGLKLGIESIVNRERYYRKLSRSLGVPDCLIDEINQESDGDSRLKQMRSRAVGLVEEKVLSPIANEMNFDTIPTVKIGPKQSCPQLKFLYKRTDELQPGDLLATRIPTVEILPDYDLPFMDEDMAYYLGLFAADGYASLSNGSCIVTLANDDNVNLQCVIDIGKRLCKNAKSYPYKGRKAFDIAIHCKIFMHQLRFLLYHGDKTKQLPFGCHLWPVKLQKALVEGLLSGDGHWKRDNLNVYATTSVHIAKMLGPIFERLGWYYCSFIQYRENRLPMYRFEIRTDGQRKSHETLYREGFVLTKVASQNPSDFEGDVVTIDVEDDHNYNTICGMSHNCEGFGMPCVDSMACGVPVAAVRYSAMEDHLESPGSIPIEVGRFFREPVIETEQRRALPDNQDFCNKLDKFLKLGETTRLQISKKIRDYIIEPVETYGTDQKFPRYSWDRTAEIWRNVLRETEIHDPQTTWLNPKPQLIKIDTTPPSTNMNNTEFVRWAISHVWNRPEMAHTVFAGKWIRGLNIGFIQEGMQQIKVDRNIVLNHFVRLAEEKNHLEQIRTRQLGGIQENEISVVTL